MLVSHALVSYSMFILYSNYVSS